MNNSVKSITKPSRIKNVLQSAKQALQLPAAKITDFLIPPRCAHCNQLTTKQHSLCGECWSQLRFIEKPYCEIMGSPFSIDLGDNILSTQAIASPPPFERLRSAVTYDDIARRLISRFKFSDRSDLAPFIASTMLRAGKELLADSQVIIPLPLHRNRLVSRRFNQSAELARIIHYEAIQNGSTTAEYRPMSLIRVKNTRQQIGLSQSGRRQNVAGAFTVPADQKPIICGKRILLIDDVYTSGASIISATKALKRGSAGLIDILTFARVHSDII